MERGTITESRYYYCSVFRYYFAVAECDSSATADYLYKSCDGIEFERSSNKLDLRFIPDSMEFKHPPRDTASEVRYRYFLLLEIFWFHGEYTSDLIVVIKI